MSAFKDTTDSDLCDFDLGSAITQAGSADRVVSLAQNNGIEPWELTRRLKNVRAKKELLLEYREVQALHPTELQAQVLEAITPEKIEEASLRDLVSAYKILKDKELVTDGKPTEIKGLVGYLVQLEREQTCSKAREIEVEVEVQEDKINMDPDLPKL